MKLVVFAAHPDDYIYGTAGTLLTHATDERHVVIAAPIQVSAAKEVAAAIGAELHLLDGSYKRLVEDESRILPSLTALLAEIMPDYVFIPSATGDWSPDHRTAGSVGMRAFADSGVYGQWNARLLRYPIPATTTEFAPNVWLKLDPSLLERKFELAATMVRGAEDIWPLDCVRWEVATMQRFAQEVGWPAQHVEAFDALYRIPFERLPARDDSMAYLQGLHEEVMSKIRGGSDLSAKTSGMSKSKSK